MADLRVSPRALRDGARAVDQAVEELTGVRRLLDTTGLTPQNWGTSPATDATHDSYTRVRTTHLASVETATDDLRTIVELLLAAADQHERAEEHTTLAASNLDVSDTSTGR